MIIPKLYGRLGNQCFQIAAAIAHAKTVGTNWRVPYRTADPRVWPTYFNNLPVARGAATIHTYTEKRHCYDPLPLHRDMLIDGYFQSEKYFADTKPEVQHALGFDLNNGGGYVALHVRRGDYLNHPNEFPVLEYKYYSTAIYHLNINLGIRTGIMVYSDDIQWCKEAFAELDFQYCTISDPIAAMRHMYNADAFIIANSTFSLFPALLRDDNPLVIAPAENRWYGIQNKKLETCDLMPERFIKL